MSDHDRFLRLKEELRPFRNLMSQASETIIRQDISSYPVFVVHRLHEVQIGIPLVVPNGDEVRWGVNASTLEELAAKGVVALEKVEPFRAVFKDPDVYICIFLVEENGGHFEFLPKTDSLI